MPGRVKTLGAAGLIGWALASGAAGQTAKDGAIESAHRQVVAFFGEMADLTCTESVMQQKIRADGHVEATAQSRYDYLIMVRASSDDFSLNESRIEAGDSAQPRLSMLVTNGFSMLLLVFHPYYSASFRFTPAPEERAQGGPLPIHFTHVPGTRSPAALSLRGREYPLDLEGTAWINPESGNVEQMDAGLASDLSDLGLRSLHIHVEYKPTTLSGAHGMDLPARAVIDVETPRQHWRNTHVFSNYKSFSTSTQQETAVKVINTQPGADAPKAAPATRPDQEERR